jgi:glyoxylase-like metal-dependent hydrolase (beta-lactamase superfamily II)
VISLSDIIPLNLADIWFPASHPLAGQQGVVLAFIIRHADGPILYDTGMGTGNPQIEELYRPAVRNLADALAAHGFLPEEIVAVATSHLHFDHCGGNLLFPGVPLYVQAADYKMAHETTFTILEWVDAPGVGYLQVAGEAELAPGVRVVPTPGHTPGHQSMLVDTSDGLAVWRARRSIPRASTNTSCARARCCRVTIRPIPMPISPQRSS